jgi:oligoendopeptidase F
MLFRSLPKFSYLTLLAIVGTTLHGEKESPLVYESRDQIPEKYKWNMSLLHESWEDWEAGLERMESLYMQMLDYKGRLSEGPDVLLEILRLSDEAGKQSYFSYGYPSQLSDLDGQDNVAREALGKVLAVYSRIGSNLSWISPEILTIPESTMIQWIDETPALEIYRFELLDTYRTSEHTLDEAGEKLLSFHSVVRNTPEEIFDALTNADGERPEVTLSDGEVLKLTSGSYGKILNTERNPADRRLVQEKWMEQFIDRRNTFAAIYSGVLNQGWGLAQSRGYESTLKMKLDRNNIPTEVVTSLVEAARACSVDLQRYQALRKEFLGLESYGWSDAFIPLMPDEREFPYDTVVPMIVDSVAFLGDEYHSKMADHFSGGLVDVFETPTKRSGAYNTGRYGVGSFVLLNYKGGLDDVFTVAHEMGHSMHTRLSQEYQPFTTHSYTIFVAEVASIINERLLLDNFLVSIDSPAERIALLELQIQKMLGTFFIQVILADFEIQAHQIVEASGGITADVLTDLWKSTVQAYFGDTIPEDDPYMNSWARIPHIYSTPFYVYQYATCFASAASLMEQMKADPAAIDRYLDLLKSGGNDYPMNQLRKAGVDLTNPEILQAVVDEFSRMIDLLETECGQFQEKQPVES